MYIIILIIVILLIYFYFKFAKKEHFSPYESTLVHDMYRSDPSGDVPSANFPGRNNEVDLFDQLLGWAFRP